MSVKTETKPVPGKSSEVCPSVARAVLDRTCLAIEEASSFETLKAQLQPWLARTLSGGQDT